MAGKKILVTGATGQIGSAVAKAVRAAGFMVRASSTDPARLAGVPDVERVRMDYRDLASVELAIAGTDGLFLIAPPLDPDAPAKLKPVIDRAKTAGIGHLVFNSALGMDQNEEAPLRIVERYLMDSGLSYTILRPNFFMENFATGFIAPMVRQGGIFLAAGEGRTSFISTQDIAAVAAKAFREARSGAAFNLTGPEALNYREAAMIISEVSGRKVEYHPVSEEEMLNGVRQSGMSEGAAQYLSILYKAVRSGWLAAVTEDVQDALGRPPVSFRVFAQENAHWWRL